MSEEAINLLIDSGLLDSSGMVINLSVLSDSELSNRISQYINGRIQTAKSEIENFEPNEKLNALFSTWSFRVTKEKILSSLLVYDSVIVDDPLVSSGKNIEKKKIEEGVEFFSWAYELIKSGFVTVVPISFFNRPTDEIPLLSSDDAFKSDIPRSIYDFIHENAVVKSAIPNDDGGMLILRELAKVKRRSALNVEFKDDFLVSGVSLFLFQTMEKCSRDLNGNLLSQAVWDSNLILSEEKFDRWCNQSINQAMRARLLNIYNESYLGVFTGHTYVTESSFESRFLSMAGISNYSDKHVSVRFLEANESVVSVGSPNDIVEFRTKYSQAFDRFNYSLMAVSEELYGIEPDEFTSKAKALFLREVQPQIDEIRDGISSIYTSGAKGGLVTLCGLAAAISTGSTIPLVPSLMLGVAGGLSEALPEVSRIQRAKKKPSYIWHRVSKI